MIIFQTRKQAIRNYKITMIYMEAGILRTAGDVLIMRTNHVHVRKRFHYIHEHWLPALRFSTRYRNRAATKIYQRKCKWLRRQYRVARSFNVTGQLMKQGETCSPGCSYKMNLPLIEQRFKLFLIVLLCSLKFLSALWFFLSFFNVRLTSHRLQAH